MLSTVARGAEPDDFEWLAIVWVVSMLSHCPAFAGLGVGVEPLQLPVEARITCDASLLEAEVFVAARPSAIGVPHKSDGLSAELAPRSLFNGWGHASFLSYSHDLKKRAAEPVSVACPRAGRGAYLP